MDIRDISPERLPLLALRKAHGHKYTYGHALIVSGGAGQTGAARLAARAALRVGAGLVTLAAPADACSEIANHITAIMLRELKNAQGVAETLRDDRMNALCIGPGLGITPAGAEMLRAVVMAGRACVLDADALTLLAQDRKLFAALHKGCVLTPHGGEFARLFPDISERLTADTKLSKSAAALMAAERAGCVVLLKGAQTVVAQACGQVAVHHAKGDRAAPWLATAGAGDVLAGFITGLMARGFTPGQAAETAVFLHVECARAFGPGLIAEDLPEEVPQVLRALSI